MIDVVMALIAIVIVLSYYHLTSTFNYWKNRGVKYLKPYPVVGSMAKVYTFQEHFTSFFIRAYHQCNGEPFIGCFSGRKPVLLIRDADLIKNILVKDFQYFTDHGIPVNEKTDPVGAKILFNMNGDTWREMRAKLTPTFTSGKMKSMFPLVLECAERLETYFEGLADGSNVDVKDIIARYTTDVIGSYAFGIQCDSINDPNCEFRQMGRKLFQSDFRSSFQFAISNISLKLAEILHLTAFDQGVTDFFRNIISTMIEMRSKMGFKRKDFLQLLIEIQNKGQLEDEGDEENNNEVAKKSTPKSSTKWTDDDVTAQAFVFFVAGFETTSSVLSFAFLELARRSDLQEKARRNIEEVLERHDGQITYESIKEMTFINGILQEALRKYPIISQLFRECTKRYAVPGHDLLIDRGTRIIIPIQAIQNDPEIYPEPEVFNPERFSEDLPNPNYYMPFGEGPRQCIGLRFAQMQSKLALISVLRKFAIEPSENTEYPIQINPRRFLLSSKQDIYVKVSHARKSEDNQL